MIEAVFLLLSGICISLWTEILFLASIFVMDESTPGLSFTSTLKYKEFSYEL